MNTTPMEKSSSSSTSKRSSVHPYKTKNLKDLYHISQEVGTGHSGTTYLCTEISTGTQYACKSILKTTLDSNENDYENVWNEIKIMHHLSDYPNVVRIKGTYEDSHSVHLVMELCLGGELFHRIEKKGRYPERKAAQIIKTIVEVVENCHSLGVIHRDLKPENVLFSSVDEDAALKVIDFGSSVFHKPGDTFSDAVGSPYYIAPEVLQKHYGPESDVWSAGVILYVLLSGVRPFQEGKNLETQILEEKIDFESEPWTEISKNAKDLTRKMLERNPKERLTSHEVLCHPWIVDDGVPPDEPLESAVLSRLKHFSSMNKFKKVVLRVIAQILKEEEIAGLKELFKMIDTDNSETISFDELKDGLRKVGSELKDPEIKILMEGADINNSGTIECDEFLAATLHLNKVEREENLKSAFSVFDIYNNGYIAIYDIQQVCKRFCLREIYLDEMLSEIDPNYVACTFSFEQFVRLIVKCYDEHDIPTKKDAIHHVSQAIRYQRHVQNSRSACCDDICDIREWLPKSKMDRKLWSLIALLIDSYLTLGRAYKEDNQLNQALKAVDLACCIYGSIPQHLDYAVFDQSSLSHSFWAQAWLLVGDVYVHEYHIQLRNQKCHSINCRCKSDSRQSSSNGTSSSGSSGTNVPEYIHPLQLTTYRRKKNLATGLTEYDKIFKFLEVGPVVGDAEYNSSVAESCYDAKNKALSRFSTGSRELRQQEAEYSYFQHGCFHRDYCLKFLEKVKQNASLAETNWQKSKEFYSPKTHPVMYLTILMEESSLSEKLSDSFHLNEMLESALSRLLEGRHVLGGTTVDFSEMNRKFLKQLQDLLNRMYRVALSGNTSKSSVIVPHSISTNTNRSEDVGKLKKLYEMSLRSIDLSRLNAMYELWSS